MTICNTLRRFLCQFPQKSWFWWSRQTRDGYSEFDVFKRSRVMNRCTGIPRTWSGVLWIDFEVKIDLNIILQGVVLKLPVTDQLQKDVTNTNRSCWSSPHSILWCKTTWFCMFDVKNRIRTSKTVIKITDPHHRMENFRKMGLVVSRDDHLVVQRVQSDCTWVNNVIQHEFSWTGPQICDHWWLKWVI